MGASIEWTNHASIVAAFGQYPKIFDDEIERAMNIAAQILVGAVREKTPGRDGVLRSLIDANAAVRVPNGWSVGIGDPTEYGETIEYGRKPGSAMPPVFALTGKAEGLDLWVWNHRDLFDDVQTEEDAAGVAFAIARKIAARGFATAPDGPGKGWGMYQKAADENGPAFKMVKAVFESAKNRIAMRCEQAA